MLICFRGTESAALKPEVSTFPTISRWLRVPGSRERRRILKFFGVLNLTLLLQIWHTYEKVVEFASEELLYAVDLLV